MTSVYKPLKQIFVFENPDTFDHSQLKVVIGDFNSHSTEWGYSQDDDDRKLVEDWANSLTLIYDAKLPPSFNSSRWKRGYNPDILFTSNAIACLSKKRVIEPIPHSQHRPLLLISTAAVEPHVPFRRQFNFRKANSDAF